MNSTQLPDQYGVIGHPVAHSWSPFIHGMFARQTGESLVYRLHDVLPENFRQFVLDFFSRGGQGLNVTVPHKVAAAELANELLRSIRLRSRGTTGSSGTTRTAPAWCTTCGTTSRPRWGAHAS
jgi:shikimate 5-dehydrogenase